MSAVARIPLMMAEKNHAALAEITAAIKSADKIEDLKEARARVEALKAWAKVHGFVKALRIDLLRIEVEALVRIVQLDGADTLGTGDRRAAEWLAAMTPLDRTKLVNESGSATTAAGLCRAVWREEEIAQHRRQAVVIGRKLAEEPEPPMYDQDAIEAARDHANSVAGSLASIADEYIENGVEFTIDEMAEEIIANASLPDYLSEDDTINKGVREVCRETVRRSPPLTINGTTIPRVITARNGKKYIRIPVMNATVAHLDDMILMRQEQLDQDRMALERLQDFAKHLREFPNGDQPESRIGELIASSITKSEKKPDAA